jgi:hypothetical protein
LTCPACKRPAQAGRSTCLYCGAPLGAAQRARAVATADAAAPHAPGPARTLLVLDLRKAEPAPLARALGVSLFEARLWARRGGYRLHRIAALEEAGEEARRLAALEVAALSLDEAAVRAAAQPLVAQGGGMGPEGLELRTARGRLQVSADDLLLVVEGPIVRERQAGGAVKRVRTAAPEPGFRIHLHRRSEPPPVELDPEVFAFGPGVRGSALLQLNAWVDLLARGRPRDQGFRHLPPALGPAETPPEDAARAVRALGAGGARAAQEALLLDNAAQFRFYSGWRGTLERLR